MGFFGTSLDERWSKERKIYLLLYAIFFVASVWASGESLARSTALPKVFCYILAFGVLALASLCLKLVKKSVSRGYVSARSVKLLFGMIVFMIAWLAILSANTHNIYYVMTIDKQREQELRNVKNQLELVQDKSIAAFEAANTKFSNDIEAEIANLKAEILNPNNPGIDKASDLIINRIEAKLGNEIDMQTKPPSSTDRDGLRQYTTDLAEKIRIITKGKLSVVDKNIEQLKTFLQKEDYQNTQRNLNDLIDNFNVIKSDEPRITQGLRNSYSMYKKTQEYIDQLYSLPIIKENAKLSIEMLPEVPTSIESESIAFVWGQFFKGEIPSLSRFLWAIGIGFILDLACFMFWYFGVLQEEE